MTNLVIGIYNYLLHHRMVGMVSFVAVTAALLFLMLRLQYKENIADFLPLDSSHQKELGIYQDISGANKIIAVFQYRDSASADPAEMEQAIDTFASRVEQLDTAHAAINLTARVDIRKMAEMTSAVYANIPYFLTDADYRRIDSLLAQPGYMSQQLAYDRSMLAQPAGSVMAIAIKHDPLNLFAPVVGKLQSSAEGMKYAMQDGYIFSPDLQRAFVTLESPYGSSETENNAKLLKLLQSAAHSATAQQGCNIDIRFLGGPVIAVGNSQQIKRDSILSVTIAVVLILALLLVAFRNVWHLALIAVSIGWGWLFAMGGLSVFHNDASIIVVGISSVILGIAVNYPLHFIAHLQHTPCKRKALREIVTPLFVGNITTVGSFLALVPLQSVALRDLGIFASFLLIGTIVFVLIYLPHVTTVSRQAPHNAILNRLGNVSLDSKPIVVWVVAVLTVVLGIFSFQTKFDTNMSHINYMTQQQKDDMAYFQKEMLGTASTPEVYAVTSGKTLDEALDNNSRLQPCIDSLLRTGTIKGSPVFARFITSQKEQAKRLALWRDFLKKHPTLLPDLQRAGSQAGFGTQAFAKFHDIISKEYAPQQPEKFSAVVSSLFASSVTHDKADSTYNVVSRLNVDEQHMARVEQALTECGAHTFDVANMNSAIANNLSNDFNYIGWACGCIVFFFLWLSFGSIELAISSFIPMAVSWLWILGIMAICNIQFNIVNVILASFIFGQGDDYTIFMTEGASYEYAYRRKMLASYKHSIIISALIMFIGIGTLVIAKHPALRSLAEVTITGMFSVVLMAYLFPPLIFKFLVKSHGKWRTRPISVRPMGTKLLLQALLLWAQCRGALRKCPKKAALFVLKRLPGIKISLTDFEPSPTVIACHSTSPLNVLLLQAMAEKIAFVVNPNEINDLALRRFVTKSVIFNSSKPLDHEAMATRFASGYSIAVVGGEEACRQALGIASRLHAQVTPVAIFGSVDVLPRECEQVYQGTITAAPLPAMAATSQPDVLSLCIEMQVEAMRAKTANAAYYRGLVTDRYRYKGVDIFRAVCRNLKSHKCYSEQIDGQPNSSAAVIVNAGYGEFALLYAIVHKHVQVTAWEPDDDKRTVLRHCAEGIAPNLTVADSDISPNDFDPATTSVFVFGEPHDSSFDPQAGFRVAVIN